MAGQGIRAVGEIRHLPSVFDRSRFGLNADVGAAYALAVLLFEASEYLVSPFLGDFDLGRSLAPYAAALAALVVLEGAVFVGVVHGFGSTWPLVVAWGLIAGAFEACFRAVAGLFAVLPPDPLPAWLLTASAAADGALLMGGLALGVRAWGVSGASFVLGATAACLVHAAPMRLALVAVRPDVAWGWAELLGWAVVRGVVTGSLIYAGVAAHLTLSAPRSPPSSPP